MYLYRCSKCGKEVVPEGFKRLSIKTFGIDVYKKNPRFCRCEKPDIEQSKKEFWESTKMIAEVIRQMNEVP